MILSDIACQDYLTGRTREVCDDEELSVFYRVFAEAIAARNQEIDDLAIFLEDSLQHVKQALTEKADTVGMVAVSCVVVFLRASSRSIVLQCWARCDSS